MKIHHWFIPTRKNKFHPVALRSKGLLVFALIFAFIPLCYNMITVGRPQVLGYSIDINVADLNTDSNQERINAGLSPLNLNSQLTAAAQAKAADMFADNYWAHVAPDGATPWTFILASGYDYSSAGENLAKDFSYSSGVVSGWMGSSSHRANVLNSTYTDVGYAVVNGVLLGEETTLVVAEYGSRAATQVAAAAPAQTTPTQTTTTASTSQQQQTAQSTPIATSSDSQKTTTTTNSNSSTTPTTTAQSDDTTKQTTTNTTTSKTSKEVASTTPTTTATTKSSNGVVEGISSSLPVKVYNSLNWGQKVSLLLVSTLALLFVMKHTMIWRQQKRNLKDIWLRAHPLGQAAFLVAVAVITVINSIGVVL